MNSIQISSILKQNLGEGFRGVFSSNQLPPKPKGPCAIVVNTDPSTEPGSHWVAIFVARNGNAEYFDSYGLKPQVMEILDFVKRFKKCQYSKKCLQGMMSSVCGHYCVYFAIQRWKNISMENIVHKFSEDLDENDEMITEWLNENFDLNTETFNVDFIINQICRAWKNSEVSALKNL